MSNELNTERVRFDREMSALMDVTRLGSIMDSPVGFPLMLDWLMRWQMDHTHNLCGLLSSDPEIKHTREERAEIDDCLNMVACIREARKVTAAVFAKYGYFTGGGSHRTPQRVLDGLNRDRNILAELQSENT